MTAIPLDQLTEVIIDTGFTFRLVDHWAELATEYFYPIFIYDQIWGQGLYLSSITNNTSDLEHKSSEILKLMKTSNIDYYKGIICFSLIQQQYHPEQVFNVIKQLIKQNYCLDLEATDIIKMVYLTDNKNHVLYLQYNCLII